MGFKCGIVGLPNVGKSTLFNALTNNKVAAQNYPFCTIEPNLGIVAVPDPRLDLIAKMVTPEQIIPTTMEFVDIAGLVRGAASGEGLGNKFLAHIREVDAIAQVLRCFTDREVIHVADRLDPIADLQVINTELLLADLETIERAIAKAQKSLKATKNAGAILAHLNFLKTQLNAGIEARSVASPPEFLPIIAELNLLTNKPIMYIANVDESASPLALNNNPHYVSLATLAAKNNIPLLAICATVEAELSSLSPTEQQEYLQTIGFNESGLTRVIKTGYELLALQTFFTAGKKEVRAWTIPTKALAPVAAGKIHSDFQKGFIRAEVVGYADFVEYGGIQGAKDAGKWRLEGKDYMVQDGDVMIFRFNV